MDYQNRVGSKKGSGGVAGDAETNQYRRERLRNLLLSEIDIDADPYVFKNHLGILECKLCLTTHMSESSYITHTHGRRHQLSLMRRAEKEKKEKKDQEEEILGISDVPKKQFTKIGKPSYTVVKIRDPITFNKGLTFSLKMDNIKENVKPLYRLMSCFEQTVEKPDTNYQYLIVSAEPYENVAFKIPGDPIDLSADKIWEYWDVDAKEYFIQLFYLSNKKN